MKQIGYQMIYVMSCALNQQKPVLDSVKQIDMTKLYQMAKFHSVTALVAMALEDAGVEISKEFKEAKQKAIRKSMLLDAEFQKVSAYLEQNKIWHMPLKGRRLKNYYPKIGMREMADTDILFDAKFREQVKTYMKSIGYEAKSVGLGNHDVYMKLPIYNYEMHVSLYGEGHKKEFREYYAQVKERLLLEEGKQYCYSFSKEDFYVYMISHEYKHYSSSGMGIRALADCFVFLKAEEQNLDWNYIQQELKKLYILEFEQSIRRLSKKIFGSSNLEELTKEERNQVETYVFSGTYGTKEQWVEKRVQELEQTGQKGVAIWIYLKQRLFPEKRVLEVICPALKRYPWLLPYVWAKRMVKAMIVRRKQIGQELKYLNKASKKRKQ